MSSFRGFSLIRNCFAVILALGLMWPLVIQAADPGFEKNRDCRANLKMLTEALDKFFRENQQDLPLWAEFEQIYTMVLTSKYVPKRPVPPLPDCAYFLMYKSPKDFSWYCNLHGMTSGDQSVSFRYHEYRFTAFVQSKYLTHPKYKSHNDELIRWTSYSPTLMENLKFQYSRNPTTTIVLILFGLAVVWFLMRNLFGA